MRLETSREATGEPLVDRQAIIALKLIGEESNAEPPAPIAQLGQAILLLFCDHPHDKATRCRQCQRARRREARNGLTSVWAKLGFFPSTTANALQ